LTWKEPVCKLSVLTELTNQRAALGTTTGSKLLLTVIKMGYTNTAIWAIRILPVLSDL